MVETANSYLAVAYATLVIVRRDLQTFILAFGHVRWGAEFRQQRDDRI